MNTTEEGKPIKRNKNIQPLSREHHFGLLFCWKIRTALAHHISPERMIPYINYFWEGHLQHHFKAEEDLLFNKVSGVLCDQGRADHLVLLSIIQLLSGRRSGEELMLIDQLIIQLDEHIRFEERVLFPFIEQSLTPDQLADIGTKLEALHGEQFSDEYADQFWVIEK